MFIHIQWFEILNVVQIYQITKYNIHFNKNANNFVNKNIAVSMYLQLNNEDLIEDDYLITKTTLHIRLADFHKYICIYFLRPEIRSKQRKFNRHNSTTCNIGRRLSLRGR
jgi:hypothetical protein